MFGLSKKPKTPSILDMYFDSTVKQLERHIEIWNSFEDKDQYESKSDRPHKRLPDGTLELNPYRSNNLVTVDILAPMLTSLEKAITGGSTEAGLEILSNISQYQLQPPPQKSNTSVVGIVEKS